ncbi:hypothetical protein D4R86_05380 [bacterium]|nr:MAG: hypothetical protein D4R86_05380 [bacterium]
MKPQLHDDDYIFNLTIHNREYAIDVKWLLHLQNEITSDLSSIELEESLEKVAGYLHTFSTAYEDAMSNKNQVELEFEIWYKEKYVESEHNLLGDFATDVRTGIRSKTNATPTKAQIEADIVTNNVLDYKKLKEHLNKIQTYTDFLYREIKIIESRATHLQSILNLRRKLMEKEF